MFMEGGCPDYLLSIHFLDKASPTCCLPGPGGTRHCCKVACKSSVEGVSISVIVIWTDTTVTLNHVGEAPFPAARSSLTRRKSRDKWRLQWDVAWSVQALTVTTCVSHSLCLRRMSMLCGPPVRARSAVHICTVRTGHR